MKRLLWGRAHLLATATALAVTVAGCAAVNEPADSDETPSGLSGSISGVGASSQDAAQQAWQSGFIEQHPDVTVDYDPVGSGGGREQFISGGSDFSGTDRYLNEEELADATRRCGQVVEVPIYVSPIAVGFNLDGIDELNLEPDTIAGIFNQQITHWDAPEIQATNPDVDLPDTRITPVNRSDESGTTGNFVEYLKSAAPDRWPHDVSDTWPLSGTESAQGTSGVVQATSNGDGTITYVDASQAGELSTADIGVGDEFVSYSPDAAADILDVSERVPDRGDTSFAYELARNTADSGTYPIVLVSYAIACTHYDDADKAKLVKNYFDYMISGEGQRTAAESAGLAPISDSLRERIQPAIDEIGSSH